MQTSTNSTSTPYESWMPVSLCLSSSSNYRAQLELLGPETEGWVRHEAEEIPEDKFLRLQTAVLRTAYRIGDINPEGFGHDISDSNGPVWDDAQRWVAFDHQAFQCSFFLNTSHFFSVFLGSWTLFCLTSCVWVTCPVALRELLAFEGSFFLTSLAGSERELWLVYLRFDCFLSRSS